MTEIERHAALAYALDGSLAPEARELAAFLARAFGASTLAVVHYGSRAQGRRTRRESAFDFFVVVERYAEAYRSLAATAGLHRAPWFATSLARMLAPNVVSLRGPTSVGERHAKVAVYSAADFGRETSRRARDHFAQARLMQHVVVAWTRDAAAEQLVIESIVHVRRRAIEWGRPFLPPRFDVEEFCRALLAQSLRSEIRPESADHARELVNAQRETLTAIYSAHLAERVDAGDVVRDGDRFALAAEPRRIERVRTDWYFRKSKARNTARLFKYVALYDGWMDYVIQKVARSSGQHISVTERERRWPLVFGWPKFIHYLRSRPQRRN